MRISAFQNGECITWCQKRKLKCCERSRSAFIEVCSLIDGCNTVEHHSGGLVDDAALCENVHISRLGISWLHWIRCGDKFDEETRTSSVGGDKYTRGDPLSWGRRSGPSDAVAMTARYVKPLSPFVLSLRPSCHYRSSSHHVRPTKLTMHIAACDNMIAFRFPIRYVVIIHNGAIITVYENLFIRSSKKSSIVTGVVTYK